MPVQLLHSCSLQLASAATIAALSCPGPHHLTYPPTLQVTTPDDMSVAGRFLEEAAAAARGAQAAAADPLEAARVEYCEKVDPSARECKVFDE